MLIVDDDIEYNGIYSWGNNELNQLGIEENKYKYYFNPIKADLVTKILNKQNQEVTYITTYSQNLFNLTL